MKAFRKWLSPSTAVLAALVLCTLTIAFQNCTQSPRFAQIESALTPQD